MAIVVDSSIAVCWGTPDEVSSLADTALTIAGEEGMQVPALFWHELANVMLVNERRGRITPELSRKAIQLVEKMLPSTDKIIDTGAILALGRQHGLSAYDAAYLELAKRIGAPLATLDRKLAQAAEAEGVPVNPTA